MLEYLLIGHFARDIKNGKYDLGGSVFYSGLTAKKLGGKVKILTSFSKDFKKEGILKDFEIKSIPSKFTTTLKNIYLKEKRIQFLYQKAQKISSKYLPREWGSPSIAQLAPIAWEIDENIIKKFKKSLIGATLQGWLRKKDKNKKIVLNLWKNYKKYLPLIDVAILSEEDINFDFKIAEEFSKYANVLVLTQGEKGCTIFNQRKSKHLNVERIIKKGHKTGVGDVFAAAYLIKFSQTKNPWLAGKFANSLAAFHLEKNISNCY